MAAQGLSVQRLADMSNVAPVTVRHLIAGKRWPWPAKRNAIEASLGWDPGRITKIAQGQVQVPGELPHLTVHHGSKDAVVLQRELEQLLEESELSRARRVKLVAYFLELLEDQQRSRPPERRGDDTSVM